MPGPAWKSPLIENFMFPRKGDETMLVPSERATVPECEETGLFKQPGSFPSGISARAQTSSEL
jgi:hypothetical protein